MKKSIKSRIKYFSINKRWLLSNLTAVIASLVILETAFILVASNYYYSTPKNDIVKKSEAISSLFSTYNVNKVEDIPRFVLLLRNEVYDVALFSEEGNFLDSNYDRARSLFELQKNETFRALENGKKTWTKTLPELSDRVLFKAFPLQNEREDFKIFALLSISVKKQQDTLFGVILSSVLVCILIIVFIVLNNVFFIRSIVTPVRKITETANEIAQGNYDVRLEKKHHDEIGRLCDAVNEMAGTLGENERMKNDFLSSVSHELKTPLTAIKGWSETILSGEGVSEETQKGLVIILKESDRLSHMVEDLLDFSRILKNELRLHKEKIDIVEEMEETLFIFKEHINEKGLRLNFSPEEESIFIFADRERMRQVFLNILDNSVKNSAKESLIWVDISVDQNNARLSFYDQGCGIRKEDLPRVKERFFKADAKKKGSGIGLAICDELIELHGGNLTIESEKDKFTRVTITLPLYEAAKDEGLD